MRKIQFQSLEKIVNDMSSMKDIMRYNGYRNNRGDFDDPSVNSPGNAIAARADLDNNPNYSGALDSKITNLSMIQTMNNYAMSGPTTSKNKYLPIFESKAPE